jgi:hypothetical protein
MRRADRPDAELEKVGVRRSAVRFLGSGDNGLSNVAVMVRGDSRSVRRDV